MSRFDSTRKGSSSPSAFAFCLAHQVASSKNSRSVCPGGSAGPEFAYQRVSAGLVAVRRSSAKTRASCASNIFSLKPSYSTLPCRRPKGCAARDTAPRRRCVWAHTTQTLSLAIALPARWHEARAPVERYLVDKRAGGQRRAGLAPPVHLRRARPREFQCRLHALPDERVVKAGQIKGAELKGERRLLVAAVDNLAAKCRNVSNHHKVVRQHARLAHLSDQRGTGRRRGRAADAAARARVLGRGARPLTRGARVGVTCSHRSARITWQRARAPAVR